MSAIPMVAVAARNLSLREEEVMTLIACGMTNAEIADALFIEETTVATHVRACLATLHARSRAHVVALWAGGDVRASLADALLRRASLSSRSGPIVARQKRCGAGSA